LETIGIDVTVDGIRAERAKLKRKERKNKEDVRPSKLPCHDSTTDPSLEDRTTATVPLLVGATTPGFLAASDENNCTTTMDSSLEDILTTAMAPHLDEDCATPQPLTLGRRLHPIFAGQDRSNPSQDRSNLSRDFLAQEPSHVYSQYDRTMMALTIETFRDELLPALLEPSGALRQEFDIDNVKNALFRLVDELRARAVARTTAVLNGKSEAEAIRTPPLLDPQLYPNTLPTLSFFGVPLNDDRIMSAILTDIWQRNRDKTGSTTFDVNPGNGHNLTLVTLPKPKSSSIGVWRRNQQRTCFLDEIAGALDPDGLVMDDSRKKLCSLLATDKVYRKCFREITHSEGFSLIDRLDEGISNYIYANLVAELQDGYESFTDTYFELEEALAQAEEKVAKVKEKRRHHELFGGSNIQHWEVSTCRV
jgi:hypothetical protein